MYGKIFESIFKSTLVAEGGWLPTYIFMSMITLADKDGLVDFAPRSLYCTIGFREYDSKISYDDFVNALQYLEQEDPNSNSTAENGRRIVPLKEIAEIDGNRGWLVVNYLEYRKKASSAEPKGASTDRVRKFRERQKKRNETECNGIETEGNGHTDTDTDTDRKDILPHKEIISHLNQKTGKSFRHQTDATVKAINARLAEGYTVDDFKHVIDVKTDEWSCDPKMEKYLCPDTLFRPKNFEKYKNQRKIEKTEPITPAWF